MAGHIDWAINPPDTSLPQLRAGHIKAYAVAAPTRLALDPDIPTVDEAGLPKFYYSLWHGLWASKGTPKEIVAKLNGAVVAALAEPQVRQRLAEMGQEIFPLEQQTPAALAAFQPNFCHSAKSHASFTLTSRHSPRQSSAHSGRCFRPVRSVAVFWKKSRDSWWPSATQLVAS